MKKKMTLKNILAKKKYDDDHKLPDDFLEIDPENSLTAAAKKFNIKIRKNKKRLKKK